MSKLKQYGFQMQKKRTDKGDISILYKDVPGGPNSALHFVSGLSKHETESFIYDLDRSLNLQENADEGFFSDHVEDIDIVYQYPNINIDDVLVLPMADMREILIEWLNFAFT
ncbi:hypothetical protein [Pedobacter mendelii]|uniref:Uncharacterized protein n=1 Tax=Pedobacter mendelii TaxID=1908240 RepID=A0ABQ2BNQ5_9SPHI|nr:hypothetical protein [Pedobacter mendelii]GGI29544.1 hypothetical protein GCM10008119_38150 [Pedobacter mendelii]